MSIAAPVASIAVLALHKWLQELHQAVLTDGPACLRQRVVLVVGHWVQTTPPTPAQTPSRAEAAPQVPPEDTAQPGAFRAALQEVAPLSSGAGISSPGRRPGRSKSPQRSQKRTASALPAVAARVFGPDHDAAADQAAVLDMVRGFGLPFRWATVQVPDLHALC